MTRMENVMKATTKIMPLIFLAAVTVGCSKPEVMQKSTAEWCIDTAKRIARFDECLKLIPKGPISTEYNDWEEVIEMCDSISYSQSKVWRPEGCLAYKNAGALK